MWEYDPRRQVMMVVVNGSAADVPVACSARPRAGAYAVRRLDETTYQIAPSLFVFERGAWTSKATDYPGGLSSEFLVLASAPSVVASELDQL